MKPEIISLTLGVAATNCYIVADTHTGEAVVIDPVDDASLIHQTVVDSGWTIRRILATHGHYDHVLASHQLQELTGAPFYIHQNAPQLDEAQLAQQPFLRQLFPPVPAPEQRFSNDSETIGTSTLHFETLFTPGHAPAHVCFFMRKQRILFGGDCLFAGSIGRTDLPYGDYNILMDSIFTQILPLGDDVRLFPGHMTPTTLGHERQTNPFLLDEASRRQS